MTDIYVCGPHPLDGIWAQAIEAMSDANAVMDKLGSDFTDEQLNAAGELRTAAIMKIMALPARTISDSLYKLDCAGLDSGVIRNDCDASAILNEANTVLNAAVARGRDSHQALAA